MTSEFFLTKDSYKDKSYNQSFNIFYQKLKLKYN